MSTFPPTTTVFNDGYIAETYEAYRRDPSSVDESWRQFFRTAEVLSGITGGAATTGDPALLRKTAGAAGLIDGIRHYGHLAVQLDPLGSKPAGAAELTPEFYGITEQELADVPASALGYQSGTAADVVRALRGVYCGRIGLEFAHLGNEEERLWFRRTMEEGSLTQALSAAEKLSVLRRLTEVDGLERFLQRAYLGYKRFSIEGTDVLVPMIDEAIVRGAQGGTRQVVMGMAHRGRLNVLTHVMGMSYVEMFGEFEGRQGETSADSSTGDVKYHLGYENERKVGDTTIKLELAPNPSHLEVVNPVMSGMARAYQRVAGAPDGRDERLVLPICIHGDAAFPGEGVVPETFNLSRLRGYRVGGTLHIIVEQPGRLHDRSDRRALDALRERSGEGIRGAGAARQRRRRGRVHRRGAARRGVPRRVREGRADRPRGLPALGAQRDRRAGVHAAEAVRAGEAAPDAAPGVGRAARARRGRDRRARSQAIDKEFADKVKAVYHEMKAAPEATARGRSGRRRARRAPEPATAVRAEHARVAQHAAARVAAGLQGRIRGWRRRSSAGARRSRQRRHRLGARRGARLRLAAARRDQRAAHRPGRRARHLRAPPRRGARRGDRRDAHAARHPAAGARHVRDLQQPALRDGGDGLRVRLLAPRRRATLVLWEAQYGDFVNVAQPIIDQFISADRAKWGQRSGLVLLLPHGYEGGGPEHSSARLERFLQLCAERNMVVAYPSTPAQYFHILRRQALRADRQPLVLMQPKSLLRLPAAASRLEDLAEGGFQSVIDDAAVADRRDEVRRLVLCTAKMYYDLLASRQAGADVALVRVDELYPWPGDAVAEIVDRYPNLEDVVWAQEEPKNMGAWSYVVAAAARGDGEHADDPVRRPPGTCEPGGGLLEGARGRADAHRGRGAQPRAGERETQRPRRYDESDAASGRDHLRASPRRDSSQPRSAAQSRWVRRWRGST